MYSKHRQKNAQISPTSPCGRVLVLLSCLLLGGVLVARAGGGDQREQGNRFYRLWKKLSFLLTIDDQLRSLIAAVVGQCAFLKERTDYGLLYCVGSTDVYGVQWFLLCHFITETLAPRTE